MKFTVVSTPLADDQLARIWLEASSPQAVADASDEIMAKLKNDADRQGQEHPSGWRVLARAPLIVTFKVSVEDRQATIISVFYRP